jgi:hypothetical protein
MTSPKNPMTSPNIMDVLAGRYGRIGTFGSRSPRRANVLLQEAAFSLEGANVALERG